MRATDIVGWLFEGALYCDDCVSDDDKQPEAYEGIGGPIFADNEQWEQDCCAGCGHALKCKAGLACDEGDCFPCAVERTAEALRDALSGIPIGVALGALRGVLDPIGYDVSRRADA